MSSRERRAFLAAKHEEEEYARLAEEYRISQLSLYRRIEECKDIDDVKAVLQIISERAGIDILQ